MIWVPGEKAPSTRASGNHVGLRCGRSPSVGVCFWRAGDGHGRVRTSRQLCCGCALHRLGIQETTDAKGSNELFSLLAIQVRRRIRWAWHIQTLTSRDIDRGWNLNYLPALTETSL